MNGVTLKKDRKTIQLLLQPKRNRVNVLMFPENLLKELEQESSKKFKVVRVEKISSTDRRIELESDEEATEFLTWVEKGYLPKSNGRVFFHKDDIYIGIRSALRKNGVKLEEETAPEQKPQSATTTTSTREQVPPPNEPQQQRSAEGGGFPGQEPTGAEAQYPFMNMGVQVPYCNIS